MLTYALIYSIIWDMSIATSKHFDNYEEIK